jgi:hypothetical protein
VFFDKENARGALEAHERIEPELLEKSGRRTWHFTDLATGNGAYKGWPIEDRIAPIVGLGAAIRATTCPCLSFSLPPR